MIHFNICCTILLPYCYTFWGTKISAMDCFFRCYFDSLPLQLPRENGFSLFCVTEKLDTYKGNGYGRLDLVCSTNTNDDGGCGDELARYVRKAWSNGLRTKYHDKQRGESRGERRQTVSF